MPDLQIEPIPLLRDNYAYLLVGADGGPVGVVDPSEAEGVARVLDARGLKLDYILNTHHHWDHTGGNQELKRRYGCQIVGPAYDRERIPEVDLALSEESDWSFGGHAVRVLATPGHTKGAVVFWFPEDQAAFCGDTLFSVGCGRLFEGTPPEMWQSLLKIRGLPAETRLYCGHEYTEANIRFALTVDPDNPHLKRRRGEVDRLRSSGKPTLPTLLGEERKTNPFLRADDLEIKRRLGLDGADAAEVFGEIRRRKDQF